MIALTPATGRAMADHLSKINGLGSPEQRIRDLESQVATLTRANTRLVASNTLLKSEIERLEKVAQQARLKQGAQSPASRLGEVWLFGAEAARYLKVQPYQITRWKEKFVTRVDASGRVWYLRDSLHAPARRRS